jgi:hypothetical protein
MSMMCAIDRSLAQCPQRTPALDTRLQRRQKEDRRTDEHQVVDPRLQHLNELPQLESARWGAQPRDHESEPRDDHHGERRRGDAYRQNGSRNPLGPLARAARDLEQLPAHASQPRTGKSLLDAVPEALDGADNFGSVEGEVTHVATDGD